MGQDTATSALVPELKHGDHHKDLPLGSKRNSVPLGLRGQVHRRVGGTGKRLGPGEHEVRLDAIAHEL